MLPSSLKLFSLAAGLAAGLSYAGLAVAQSPIYGQCGGIGWSGATSCVSGSHCVTLNAYYFQCLPGTVVVTSTVLTSSTTVFTSTPTSFPPSSVSTSSTSPTTTAKPSTTTPRVGTTTGHTTATLPPGCSAPSSVPGYNNAKLPNPFLFDDGTPVKTAADWACRRDQIMALIQGYEAGTLPGPPPRLSASFTNNGATGSLFVLAEDVPGGTPISWSSTITFPNTTAPAGGWPLVIAYEGGSIPIPEGFAVLNYANSAIAAQDSTASRGQGLFYQLYGASHSASAMTAWTWGVSRMIDVLQHGLISGINPSKIAVTGCSRDGKGALMAGAFDDRIALTIPQESGSGGDACWRLSLYEQNSGSAVQTATEIVTENVWFSTNFNNYVNNLNSLPYDHHLLAALVAPRGLISYENTDYVWLSPLSSYGCMTAAHTVYTALGVPDNHGFEQVGGHAHCAWPDSLTPTLNAFFDKFLLGQNVSTADWSTNGQFNGVSWNASDWIDWTTPTLT